MKLIQFILVPLVIVFVLIYFKKLRSKLFDRVIVLGFGVIGVLLVLFPDVSQALATRLGVGRGVDLLTYIGFIGLIFLNAVLFSKIRTLESMLTKVVRDESVREGKTPKE